MRIQQYIMTSVVLLVISISVRSQSIPSNPYVHNSAVILDDTGSDGYGYFYYGLSNTGYTYTGELPTTMTICMTNIVPRTESSKVEDVSGVFTWSYDTNTNCYIGIQQKSWTKDTESQVYFSVKTKNKVRCDKKPQIGFNVNIQPSAYMNGYNDTQDDHTSSYTCVNFVSGTKEESEEIGINIMPNPTTGISQLRVEGLKHYVVKILNNLGQEMDLKADKREDIEILDMSGYKSRIYHVMIQDEKSGQVSTEKLILIK